MRETKASLMIRPQLIFAFNGLFGFRVTFVGVEASVKVLCISVVRNAVPDFIEITLFMLKINYTIIYLK